MKRTYETPTAEKVAFQYQEQVAASNQTCTNQWINTGDDTCQDFEWVKNFEA
ncbi:MAG: hypothetical protein ACI3XR_09365 [Eubacteriales bacterium]